MAQREDELRRGALAILRSANLEAQSRGEAVQFHPRFFEEAQRAVALQKTDLEFAKRQILVGRFVGAALILLFGAVALFVRDHGVEYLSHGLIASLGIFISLICISLFVTPIEKRYGRGRFSVIQVANGKRILTFEIVGH